MHDCVLVFRGLSLVSMLPGTFSHDCSLLVLHDRRLLRDVAGIDKELILQRCWPWPGSLLTLQVDWHSKAQSELMVLKIATVIHHDHLSRCTSSHTSSSYSCNPSSCSLIIIIHCNIFSRIGSTQLLRGLSDRQCLHSYRLQNNCFGRRRQRIIQKLKGYLGGLRAQTCSILHWLNAMDNFTLRWGRSLLTLVKVSLQGLNLLGCGEQFFIGVHDYFFNGRDNLLLLLWFFAAQLFEPRFWSFTFEVCREVLVDILKVCFYLASHIEEILFKIATILILFFLIFLLLVSC